MRSLLGVRVKDPSEVLDYTIDWTDWLNGGTISGTPVWTVPSGMTKVSQSNTTTAATVVLSGGTAGVSYDVSCAVTTSADTGERTFRVVVELR